MFGLAIYAVATVASALAPSISWLIACRAVQGVGVTYATSPMGADHTAGYAVCQNVLKVGGDVSFGLWLFDLRADPDERTNVVGVRQGTCVHLGNCDIGCDVNARNTLDLNVVPAVRRATWLPVIVDPSHALGRRDLVIPMAKAAVVVGAAAALKSQTGTIGTLAAPALKPTPRSSSHLLMS